MTTTRLQFFGFAVDSPSEVIDVAVTFTLSSKVVQGGFGRLGRGWMNHVIMTTADLPAALGNYGYTA